MAETRQIFKQSQRSKNSATGHKWIMNNKYKGYSYYMFEFRFGHLHFKRGFKSLEKCIRYRAFIIRGITVELLNSGINAKKIAKSIGRSLGYVYRVKSQILNPVLKPFDPRYILTIESKV